MCGIAFRTIGTLKNMLETQSSRGMDGIGLIYQAQGLPFIHKFFATKDYKNWIESSTSSPTQSNWFFTDDRTYSYQKMEEWYQDILENGTRKLDQNKFVFAHHRKGTVGSNGIDNTHPFEGAKFILAQNGTDKRIHEWGIIEGMDPDRSDTFVLLQYLEMHCNTLQECVERLGILMQRKVTIGTVMIYSKSEQKFMFFADGERSLYIQREGNKIEYIQSRKDDSTKDYKTKGYLVCDWEGNILVEDLRDVNVEKYVAPATTTYPNQYGGPYHGTQSQLPAPAKGSSSPYNYHWDEDDWDDFTGEGKGFQDINPDVDDVNSKEEWYDYIEMSPLEDVMEYLDDLDEKRFKYLKGRIAGHIASKEENEEYVDIIVYAGMLVKRAASLVSAEIKEIETTRTSLLDLGKVGKDVEERNKRLTALRYKMMQINSIKDIYKL